MPSFTQRTSNLRQSGPLVAIRLAPANSYLEDIGASLLNNKYVEVSAMIDTGANRSVIQQGIASQLNLNPVGSTLLFTPSIDNSLCYLFDVQMIFPNNVIFQDIAVVEAPLQGQNIQCLIGRDVLQHGLLVYNGYDNAFTLSF